MAAPAERAEEPWSPLLAGAEAEEARREVARIAASLAVPVPRDAALGPALLAGRAGIALFHGYLHLADPQGGHLANAEAWLARAVDNLEEEHPLSLYTGATGVACVAQHLAASLGMEEDGSLADLLRMVDEAVLTRVRENPWTGPLDLIHGLAGYGVYLLPRAGGVGPAGMALAEVVERLGELAREEPGGITWATKEGGIAGTGVAHGAAGILYVLAGAAAKGCNAPKARRLLEGGIDRLFRLQREGRDDRLAWCRGDAGIAAALSAIQGFPDRRCREIALRAATRRPESSGVEDAALCHGAAGLGHLFNRIYQRDWDPVYAARARFWLLEALHLRRLYPESGGYPRLTAAPRDFLCGEAGIGLALLAAISDIPPAWDQLLCVSVGPLQLS